MGSLPIGLLPAVCYLRFLNSQEILSKPEPPGLMTCKPGIKFRLFSDSQGVP